MSKCFMFFLSIMLGLTTNGKNGSSDIKIGFSVVAPS